MSRVYFAGVILEVLTSEGQKSAGYQINAKAMSLNYWKD